MQLNHKVRSIHSGSFFGYVRARRRCASKLAVCMGLMVAIMLGDASAIVITGQVWDVPNSTRIAYNPATGNIGNMGKGWLYEINTVADAVRDKKDAKADVTEAFNLWNALGTLTPGIKIAEKLENPKAEDGRSHVTINWGAEYTINRFNPDTKMFSPEQKILNSGGRHVNSGPDTSSSIITLNKSLTVRTDGWNLDYLGNRPNIIDEFDIFSTVVHEIGHSIGLSHPGSTNLRSIMTAQNVARKLGGSWRVVEVLANTKTVMRNDGTLLPITALGYKNPRSTLAADDILGAVTLYSAPVISFQTAVEAAGGANRYTYTAKNNSDNRSDYKAGEIFIPVAESVRVFDFNAPNGWVSTRESTGVRFRLESSSDITKAIAPGKSHEFSFKAGGNQGRVTPTARWRVTNLRNKRGIEPGQDLDEDAGMLEELPFNPLDFGVLGGSYTYAFDNGKWRTLLINDIVVPVSVTVSEPTTLILLGLGLLGLGAIRRRKERSRGVRPEQDQGVRH